VSGLPRWRRIIGFMNTSSAAVIYETSHSLSFAKRLSGNPSIGGILSALGVVAPGAGIAEPVTRRPRAERGNLKAPEVTQLNNRLTTKLHKRKVCDTARPIL
jgi:hypothetical protein